MSKKNSYNIVKLVNLKLVKEEAFRNYSSISSEADIVGLMKRYIQDEYREVAFIIGMDTNNRPCLIHKLGMGGINNCPVPVASIIKPLLLANCSTAILMHNHPSDTMNPSEADLTLTNRVRDAMKLMEMELLDHIIVNSDCSQSYSMRGSLHW